MVTGSPVHLENLQGLSLAGCRLACGLGGHYPHPCWPLLPLSGACLLLSSRGLQGKEKWSQGS